MADMTTGPRLWAAVNPISDGLLGFRKPDIIRVGLVAGGLAFSAALLLASIQHPTASFDLLTPKPGLSQDTSIDMELSDLPNLPFDTVSSLATVLIDRFHESSNHKSTDVRQFLDFVQREFPNFLMRHPSGITSQQFPGVSAAAMTPPLVFAPPHLASAAGGGGGGGGGSLTEVPPDPISGLPPWWDIPAWIDILSGA